MDVNRYPLMKSRLPTRVSSYIDGLDREGQIDRDEDNFPYVVTATHQKENGITVWRVKIKRNGRDAIFVINPRSKKEPMINWNPDDGYVRIDEVPETGPEDNTDGKRRERALRTESAGKIIVNRILKD